MNDETMQAVVLIPAAGMGRRMGAAINKQYLELGGRPILAHTLALFEEAPEVAHIYPIVPADELDFCARTVLAPYSFSKVRRLVPGGRERQDSVANGLRALREDGFDQPGRPVLIHDGVRPLFDRRLVPALLAAIERHGAALIGAPAKDTIKVVAGGLVRSTPPRERLWQAQTPQGATYGRLAEAFRQAAATGLQATDDAALLEAAGQPVAMVAGDYRNIKVTTPEDLVMAAALLDMPRENSA